MFPYRLCDLETLRKHVPSGFRTDTFRYEPRKRCWFCQQHCQELLFCRKCFHVFYCSIKCQEEDLPRHRKQCYPDSFYEQKCGAIIIANHDSSESEHCSITITARSIMLSRNISPNRILVLGGHDTLEYMKYILDLYDSLEDLKFFLEKGLRIDIFSRHMYYHLENNWVKVKFFIDYSLNKEISFPVIRCPDQENLSWSVNTGVDINEIFQMSTMESHLSEELLFVVRNGYDLFNLQNENLIDLVLELECPLLDEVVNIWKDRGKWIFDILDDLLIKDLINIVLEYLNMVNFHVPDKSCLNPPSKFDHYLYFD